MGIVAYARAAGEWVFDTIISPPFCAHCKKFLSKRTIFCFSCDELIKPIVSVQVELSQKYTVKVLAVSGYSEPLKSLIIAKSWSDIVAAVSLGNLIWEKSYFSQLPCDYLLPVPLHWTRYAKRGFNQAHEIAKVLSEKRSVPIVSLVKRHKRTPFQSKLPIADRADNVKQAFALSVENPELYRDKHIVIVDDLYTTGSTVKSIARELVKLKPASISVIVACRVV